MKKVLKLSEKHPEVRSALGVYPIKYLKLSQKEFQKNLDFIKENSEKSFINKSLGYLASLGCSNYFFLAYNLCLKKTYCMLQFYFFYFS